MLKKKYFPVVILGTLLVLFLIIMPIGVHAFGFGDVVSGLINLGLTLKFGIPLLILTTIAYGLAIVAALLAEATTTVIADILAQTLNIAVVPGKTVGIVQIGWEFTRDFVNMFLLLMLVFIGLATILRLEGYSFQRTLPRLVLVALFVNFSAVFVGFVVDIANLFINFFVSRISSFNLIGPAITLLFNDFLADLGRIFGSFDDNPLEYLMALATPLAKAALLAAFFGVMLLVLFTVALIFLARVAVLWILTIFAPLAFAMAVFPATQRYWNMWRDSLISWSIVGIPISFFLYMATWMASHNAEIANELGIQQSGGLSDAVATLFAPAVMLITLMVGVGLSISLAPGAARGIISLGRGLPKMALKSRTAKRLLGKTAFRAQEFLGWQQERFTSAAQRLDERAKGSKGIAGYAMGTGAKTMGAFNWASRSPDRLIRPKLIEYATKQRSFTETPPGFEKWDPRLQQEWIEARQLSGEDKFQAIDKIVKAGNIRFTSKALQNEAQRLWDKAVDGGDRFFQDEINNMARAYPENLTEEGRIRMHLMRAGASKKDIDKVAAQYKADLEQGTDKATDEKVLANLKLERIKPEDAAGLVKTYKEDIDKTAKIIQERLGDEKIQIETGVELKIFTRDEAKQNPSKVAQTIRDIKQAIENGTPLPRYLAPETTAKLTSETRTKLRNWLRDTAATTSYVRDLRPEYIKLIADPDEDPGTRMGITLGAPENFRQIQQNFGRKTLLDMIEGPGGLNEATNTPEKMERFYKDAPQLARAIFTNPFMREIPIEGRNQLRDIGGRPTTNFKAFETRMKINRQLEAMPDVGTALQNLLFIRRWESELRDAEAQIARARTRNINSGPIQKTRDDLQQKIKDGLRDLENLVIAKIEPDPEALRMWRQLEQMISLPQQQGRRGRRRGP